MNHLVAAKHFATPVQPRFLIHLAVVLMAWFGVAGEATAAGTRSVTLAWDANPEANIDHYELRYGTSSGSYSSTVNAGASTSATAGNLTQGVTYYFAVVAVNTSGLASAPSSQVVYTVPTDPNTAPTANPFSLTVLEDGQVAATLSGSDPQGDSLTYSILISPTKGTLSGTAPNLTYRPNANANGSDSFTYRVNDGEFNSSSATVSISITPVNDLPVAAAKSVTTTRNTSVGINLSGTDVEGSSLTFSILSGPSKGSLSGTAPNLTYQPNNGVTGSDSFTYRVHDGTGYSAAATVSITINGTNTTPVAHGKSVNSMKNKTVAVTLSGDDADANPLTFTVLSQPASGTLSGTPPNMKYTPERKWTGTVSFTYRVSDGVANSPPATVTIRVKDKNRRPVANSAAVVANQNSSKVVVVTGTDLDEDPLTFEIVRSPSNGTISGTSPNFVYTPNAGFKGKDRFSFRALDGTTKSKPAWIDVSVVNPNNRAPVAQAMNLSGPVKKPVVFGASGSDADGDPLTFRVVSGPSSGVLKLNKKGVFRYKPTGLFEGADSFTYVANDGVLDSAPVTVTLTIGAASGNLTARNLVEGDLPVPTLALRSVPGDPGSVRIQVTGLPGQSCVLESSTNLTKWSEDRLIEIDASGGATLDVAVPAEAGRGFFRLRTP
ncbi:Ig-like domain-containing protein [Luteolibacter marinus]|uniref:Ig-like domain-containing protein n=1 Tax=Luteolibacter marinus TaxID=2776705 RepID=UPI001866A6C7|nr:Ig-like domain-containing protein [Luteolibacter marinus]